MGDQEEDQCMDLAAAGADNPEATAPMAARSRCRRSSGHESALAQPMPIGIGLGRSFDNDAQRHCRFVDISQRAIARYRRLASRTKASSVRSKQLADHHAVPAGDHGEPLDHGPRDACTDFIHQLHRDASCALFFSRLCPPRNSRLCPIRSKLSALSAREVQRKDQETRS